LREKILKAAKAANYSMPWTAAGQKVIVAASSAAMIDYVRNQFTLHVLEGLRERAVSLGLELVTRPIASTADEGAVLAEARQDDRVLGLLFLTLDDEDMLAATRSFDKAVVLVNGDDPEMRLSSVTPCNRSAARLATDHLIGLGHRDILFLMRAGRRTIERRREGWQDALAQAGIPADPDRVVLVDDWLPELGARAIVERVRQRGLDFTAVLAAGDSLAVGAMMGIQQLGYTMPDDVSVMGMDDLPQGAFLNPPLTTMHIPMHEIGAAALDLLREQVAGPPALARRIELACHLVERQSTAKARSA
jgi:DNA-binding LacI/PurR family transcriptional regulator